VPERRRVCDGWRLRDGSRVRHEQWGVLWARAPRFEGLLAVELRARWEQACLRQHGQRLWKQLRLRQSLPAFGRRSGLPDG
jgi:hypothetical protein